MNQPWIYMYSPSWSPLPPPSPPDSSGSSQCTRPREKGTLLHCWWECKLVQPLWRTVWRFLKKLELELPYDPAIPLLGIHTEETRSERDTCTPMFIAALFIIARTWKQARCPSADEWIRKLWYISTSGFIGITPRLLKRLFLRCLFTLLWWLMIYHYLVASELFSDGCYLS